MMEMKQLLHRRHAFTLVEILIAMGVCVIGLCSIMVFFPVASNASRNAVMSSHAANVAEQLLALVKTSIEDDKLGPGYAAFKHFTGWNPGNPSGYTGGVHAKPEPGYHTDPANLVNDTGFTDSSLNWFSERMQKAFEAMVKNDTTKVTICTDNVYYFDFLSKIPDPDDNTKTLEVSDYTCYACIWATPVEVVQPSGTVNNIPFAARIHVEVSWPAEIPYSNRQKREFALDVFKAY